MDVVGLNYYPAQFMLKKGVPVRWEINGRKAQGCGQVISVPSLGITEFLEYNKDTVIEFTPASTGRIGFSCTMGMAGPGFFEVTT